MKNYFAVFGSGDPRSNTGLFPTFILFFDQNGATRTPPGITEVFAGSGMYQFQYAPSLGIGFLLDGGSALSASARYISGNLDPIQAVDEKVGTVNDSFGSTAVDPSTVLGYLKRGQEFSEGNATYTKADGKWSIFSRGSSTMLTQKTLANNTTEADKT